MVDNIPLLVQGLSFSSIQKSKTSDLTHDRTARALSIGNLSYPRSSLFSSFVLISSGTELMILRLLLTNFVSLKPPFADSFDTAD